MLQHGFLKKHSIASSINTGTKRIAKFLLYGGVLIILTGLIYMIFNLSHADTIITVWVPFMVCGVVLVFLSIFIRSPKIRTRY